MTTPITDIRIIQFWVKAVNEEGQENFQPANYVIEVQRDGIDTWERLEIVNQVIDLPPAPELNS